MALFLNRLGGVVKPTFLHAQAAVDVPAGTQAVTCRTAPYSVIDYPRSVTGDASGYFYADADAGIAGMRLVYSLDGGANWTNWSGFRIYTNVTTAYSSSSATSNAAFFDPGQEVIFGVLMLNATGPYHAGCEMRVRIDAAE